MFYEKLKNFGVVLSISVLLLCSANKSVVAQESTRSPLEDHRVVLMGDSQVVGNFGRGMSYELPLHGVTYFARSGHVGWGVTRWLSHRYEIRGLIRRHQPTLFLIELGGNDFLRSARSDYVNEVQELWDFINGEMASLHAETETEWRVIWISPATAVEPNENIQPGRDRAASTILTVVTDRNYVESRDITGSFGRTPDGIHFTPGGGQDWASQLIPRLEYCLER